jgi:hypothetical protein
MTTSSLNSHLRHFITAFKTPLRFRSSLLLTVSYIHHLSLSCPTFYTLTGIPFKSSTYYDAWSKWIEATQEQHDGAEGCGIWKDFVVQVPLKKTKRSRWLANEFCGTNIPPMLTRAVMVWMANCLVIVCFRLIILFL